MFVKTGIAFQKLLDKKSPRIAAYGDSKGFRLFKRFMSGNLFFLLFLFKYNLIAVHQPKLRLCCLFYVFFGIHIFLIHV